MNNTPFGTTLLLAIGVVGFGGTMRGAGQYLKIDYPASTASNELQVAVTYTIWIPEGVKTLRGIIVHQHGAGTTASIEGSTSLMICIGRRWRRSGTASFGVRAITCRTRRSIRRWVHR